MKSNEERFIYIKKDLNLDGYALKQFEIGIIQNDNSDVYEILIISINKILSISKDDFNYFKPSKTGDNFSVKVCNVCQRLLPTTHFALNQNAKNNRPVRRPSCNECRINIDGKGISAKDRALWNKKKPNLEPFQCPICLKTTIPGLNSKVVLDHDHTTGQIRGFICDSCNTGIGRFKDDINLLEKAIHYLKAKEE